MKILSILLLSVLLTSCGTPDTPQRCDLRFAYNTTRTDQSYTTAVYRADTHACGSFFTNNSGRARLELSSPGKALRIRVSGLDGTYKTLGETVIELQLPIEQKSEITLELDFLPQVPAADIPSAPTASAAVMGRRG